MKNCKISLFIITGLSLSLLACTPRLYHDAEKGVATSQLEANAVRDHYQNPQLPLQRITPATITLGTIHAQPAWLNKKITIRGNQLPFEMFVNKLITHTPGVAAYENSVNRNQPVSLNYSGTVKGALDALAAKADYSYDLDGNTLTWSAFVTKTFDISFMPGASQYLLGKKRESVASAPTTSANVATGSFTNEQYSNLQGTLSVWKDLKSTLDSMKSKEGQIIVSEATTTITVRDKPENVRVIANYLASMDKNMSQQVALDVQVLEVNLDKGFNYGINWGLVRNFMSGKLAARIGSADSDTIISRSGEPFNLQGLGNATSTVGFGILSNSGLWNGTDLFINAIGQQGKVSVSTQPRVVTLNNQVAEININHQTTYLAQITSTQTLNVGTTVTMTPGVVSAGFSLYLLPKIQGNNVYLQISSTISNLEKLDKFSVKLQGSGEQSIQLPTVAQKLFNLRSVVPTGSTLILAGFKQLGNNASKVSVFGSDALGGRGGEQSSSETIVLITPTVIRVDA